MAGAALLAACGGSDSDDGSNGDVSGLVTRSTDTSAQAKRGGVLIDSRNADLAHFDPHLLTASHNFATTLAYNRLAVLKPGHLGEPDGSIVGDLVESWEYSGDRLTLTMKVRPNVRFSPVAPVNGRALEAQDVLTSWERFAARGTNRSLIANAANPAAPVLSLTMPDARTIVVKLAEPVSSVMASFASVSFHVHAKEADSGFDARSDQAGTGPYYRSEYVPSARIVFKRNPNYHDTRLPYVEQLEYPIITEYASGLAQLRAGAIHTYIVKPEDILPIKRDVPAIGLYQGEVTTPNLLAFFGWRASAGERTPFRDTRVRQAFSMSLDRNTFINVALNVDQFRSEGLPVETRWNSALYSNVYKGWWLDPQSRDFGPNAKYFEHNVAESKKLLAAAGFPNGVEVVSNHITTNQYGIDFPRQVEIMLGMAQEAGIRSTIKPAGWTTNWVPEFRDSRGDFEGLSFRGVAAEADIGDRLYDEYSKNGARFTGFDPAGSGSFGGDPQVEALLQKIKLEFEDSKRKEYAAELQRYLGQMQYVIRNPGGATAFELAWPAMRNFRTFTGSARAWHEVWIDETQPPISRS